MDPELKVVEARPSNRGVMRKYKVDLGAAAMLTGHRNPVSVESQSLHSVMKSAEAQQNSSSSFDPAEVAVVFKLRINLPCPYRSALSISEFYQSSALIPCFSCKTRIS
jgi:hypothetical protein